MGRNIRRFRHESLMTQKDLGVLVGVTTQQIQKYEMGHDRVSASRLWDISTILNIKIELFFAESDASETTETHNQATDRVIELVKLYQAMPKHVAATFLKILRNTAEADASGIEALSKAIVPRLPS
ncbi:helix-turn-helix domain-containing protein [Paracoccus aminophilus]|uniref:helix-turn-helix domain-containing protein n=1 Tax=Paracoccus aminophilus TaxID=34003 RepID=UPI0022A75763|nr:helix-turn-helix domain-containing protein [Paracoccus aminophilus]